MMRRFTALALLFIVIAGAAGLASIAEAQFGVQGLGLRVNPQYPRPYSAVTIIPESSSINLSASTLVTTVNGAEYSRTTGAEAIYVTLGAPGSATVINVRATGGGQTNTASVTLRPADVSLIVEPIATAHPLYRGGSQVASEGIVRLVAIADIRGSNGVQIPSTNLVYTWKNREQILESASGIGKSTLTATAPPRYRDARITVTVTTQDQSVVAEAGVDIFPNEPLVRVYRTDPLLGPLFNVAVQGKITLAEDEESFRAVPYHFASQPGIRWEVNGRVSESDPDMTVRPSGSRAGAAKLDAIAQNVRSTFRVEFGASRGLGIFGI